jgi:hypothetical protein
MAYLDVREPVTIGAPRHFSPSAQTAELREFGRQEWAIIALAESDGLASLREPGRLGRFLAFLFGGDINRALSDSRLEALRRLAVFAWHYGYAVPVSAIKAFKAAGFSEGQFDVLMSAISGERAHRRSRRWSNRRSAAR